MKYLTSILLFLMLNTSISQAAIWTCDVKVVRGYKGVMPKTITFDFDRRPGGVIISDDVGATIGRKVIQGKLNRLVRADQLFGWELSPVPQSLKPPSETKFYENKVVFTGRLNTQTGKLKIIGDFVVCVPSANTGRNMRGTGVCRR